MSARGGWYVDPQSITSPPFAGPGEPRIVDGPEIPPELIAYYNVGLASITSVRLWYYGNAIDTYHYYGVIDLGGGAPPGNVVRGDVLGGVVIPLDTYVGADYFVHRQIDLQGNIFVTDAVATENILSWNSSFTSTWTANGAATTLGTGTIITRYMRLGTTCHVQIRLTWGATTTAPAGKWEFSLPFGAANNEAALDCFAWDNSASLLFPCVARIRETPSPTLHRIGAPSGAAVSTTVPMAWAASDVLSVNGIYRCDPTVGG